MEPMAGVLRVIRSFPLFAVLLLLVSAGCGRANGKQGPAADARPKVTVASPVVASVVDYTEHTGHAEAPEAVEIRARASGHLLRSAFKEGDLVKKGDLLFVVDPRPYQASLARARAELQSARADHALARRNTARNEVLFKSGVISQQAWDSQTASEEQLAARESAALAAVSSAELDLDYAYVRSPISGRIGRMLVTPGNLVGPSTPTPLATVVSVSPLYVYLDLEEVRALRLGRSPGATAQIGFPGEEGYPHQAPIDFVDNRIDPATGTIKVRAVLENADGRLTHGLFARVRLGDGERHPALLISDRAVANDQDRRFVWVLGQDGKAQHRPVKLGNLDGGLRVVREGLTESDQVVVRGLQRLRPGAAVQAQLVSMREADGALASAGSAR
jgi:RND family efflux transporter MFP subunit